MVVADGGGAIVTVDSGIATITIDRPPVNALDVHLLQVLSEALEAAVEDAGVRVILFTGTGTRFVAGADIKTLQGLSPESAADFVRTIQGTFDLIEAAPKPTIAVINGDALGGGLELALACDIRFAATNARLGLPEIRLGLIPGAGGTQRLTEVLGRSRALEMLYTGAPVSARDALALGMVNKVFEPQDVMNEALKWARSLAAGPRHAYAAAKECVQTNLLVGREQGLLAEASSLARLLPTPDGREGIAAFIEKRSPLFEGS